jgi:hypothetical protein
MGKRRFFPRFKVGRGGVEKVSLRNDYRICWRAKSKIIMETQ